MSEHFDFYLPIDLATRKLYHEWIRGMLASNTFLVLPDVFVHARTAALLSFNFLQFYPTSSVIIVNADKEKDSMCAQLKAVGIPLPYIHQIKDDKQFKKQCADGIAGVFFVTTKTMINMLGKNSFDKFDFKLMVICGAEKADSNSALAKVVSGGFGAGKIFRVLALSFALPKKIAKAQSLTSNLQIHRTLIKKTNDHDVAEILFSRDTSYIDFEYNSRELELMKLMVTVCVENLVHLGITCTQNLQCLFYMNTEVWLKEIPEDSEHHNLIAFTVAMIEGYQILVQYGTRALFLYFASKSDVLTYVEENDVMKELNERLKVVDFGSFPNHEKRPQLQCHPKFQELFKIVNTDKRNENYIVFCSSPFGARAVTEFLVASRVRCIQNVSDFYELMKDKPHLRGDEPFTAEDAKRTFFNRPDTPVMVSTNFVENLGTVIFERSISMDYLVSGLRYTRFGRQSWCLLTDGYENIPLNMRNYERRLANHDVSHDYKFNTVASKLKIEKIIKIHPVQYCVADMCAKESDAAATKAASAEDKHTVESVQQGEMFLKSKMGDFSMDHLRYAFNDTVDLLNERNPKNPFWLEKYVKNANENSTSFEKSLHSALYDPLNPQHVSFASKFPNVEFAEWDLPADEPLPPQQQPQPPKHQPRRLKKIRSKKSLESNESPSTNPVSHYFVQIKDPKLSEIKEKIEKEIQARRMYQRQRWLCVLRDAAKSGHYIAVGKEVMAEIEKLPSSAQFWDYA